MDSKLWRAFVNSKEVGYTFKETLACNQHLWFCRFCFCVHQGALESINYQVDQSALCEAVVVCMFWMAFERLGGCGWVCDWSLRLVVSETEMTDGTDGYVILNKSCDLIFNFLIFYFYLFILIYLFFIYYYLLLF